MIKNICTLDRGIRVVIGLFILLLIVMGEIIGTAAIIFGLLAAALIITSSLGTCPIYIPFKIFTNKREKTE